MLLIIWLSCAVGNTYNMPRDTAGGTVGGKIWLPDILCHSACAIHGKARHGEVLDATMSGNHRFRVLSRSIESWCSSARGRGAHNRDKGHTP